MPDWSDHWPDRDLACPSGALCRLGQQGYDIEPAVALRRALELGRELEETTGDANEAVGASWLQLNISQTGREELFQLVEEADALKKTPGVSLLNRLALAASSANAMLNLGMRGRADEYYAELVELVNVTRHVRGGGMAESIQAAIHEVDGNLALHEVTTANAQYITVANLRVGRWMGLAIDVPGPSPVPREIRSILPQVVEVGSLRLSGRLDEAKDCFAILRSRVLNEKERLGRRPLSVLLELAVWLDDREVVAGAYTELQKSDTMRFINTGLTHSLPLIMATAAAYLGRWIEARDYFQNAIDFCKQMHNRPELALTRLGLAELLLDHYPDEHAAAIEHLDFAIAEFREMKMQPALERALGRRGLLKA